MQVVYKLKTSELNEQFLLDVKKAFFGKSIEISVSDTEESNTPMGIGDAIENFRKQVSPTDLGPGDGFVFKEVSLFLPKRHRYKPCLD